MMHQQHVQHGHKMNCNTNRLVPNPATLVLLISAALVNPATSSSYNSMLQPGANSGELVVQEVQDGEEEVLVEVPDESAEDADHGSGFLFFHQQQEHQQLQRVQAQAKAVQKQGNNPGGDGRPRSPGSVPVEASAGAGSDSNGEAFAASTSDRLVFSTDEMVIPSSLSRAIALAKLGRGAEDASSPPLIDLDSSVDWHSRYGMYNGLPGVGAAAPSPFPALFNPLPSLSREENRGNVRISYNEHNARERRADSYTGCALRTVYEESIHGWHGNVTDGPQSYLAQRECSWLVRAANASNNPTITLSFSEYATECSYDYLFVYDGGSPDAVLLATLSGSTLPIDLVAHSGEMLIVLYSDTNYVLAGFEATYTIAYASDEEGGTDGNDGAGNTDAGDDEGGANTAAAVPRNTWQTIAAAPRLQSLSSPTPYVFEPRAKHTAVYDVENDAILVFGGYNFVGLYADLFRFHFTNASWSLVHRGPAAGGGGGQVNGPAPRHSQTAVLHRSEVTGNGLFVLGGTVLKEVVSDEFWRFDLTTSAWQQLQPAPCSGGTAAVLRVPSSNAACVASNPTLTGHTMTVVADGGFAIVIGGRSTAETGFEHAVYEYTFITNSWLRHPVAKESYTQVAGHTTVYHEHSRALLTFGGFRPSHARYSERDQAVYRLAVDTMHWTVIPPAEDSVVSAQPQPLAFHSAVFVDGNTMVVLGGSQHSHFKDEVCYNPDVYGYDVRCNTWVKNEQPSF